MTKNSFKSKKGLGSSSHAVHHWWAQRISAIALLIFTIYFLYIAIGIGLSNLTLHEELRKPYVALLFILYGVTLLYHGQLGIQVIFEDYIPSASTRNKLLIFVKILAYSTCVAWVFGIVYNLFQ